MQRNLLILLLLTLVVSIQAQKQANIWMFGKNAGLNFNTPNPTPITGSQVSGAPSEGCTSISDVDGNLLFYSNGEKVWNKLNQVMLNGTNLRGHSSSTSAAFAIPMPLNDSLFYLFTTDGMENYLQGGLRYSIINMCKDAGNGAVESTQKNIPLLDKTSEKLCAIRHPNSVDIWLIAHKHFTDAFYAYLITPTGISAPIVTNIGSVHTGGFGFYNGCGTAIGQMKASSDGTKIGLVFSNVTPAVGEIFDFDAETGVLSKPLSLHVDNNAYGVEFSPDGKMLYITSLSGLNQFDISSENAAMINASKTLLTSAGCLPGPLQLAPNGKIYVARCTSYVGAINFPNKPGTACTFINYSVNIAPGFSNSSLPSFIAGFNYTNNRINCGRPSSTQDDLKAELIKIFPNPFSLETTIFLEKGLKNANLTIRNSIGSIVRQEQHLYGKSIQIVKNDLPAGLYFLQIEEDTRVIFSKKIVIE